MHGDRVRMSRRFPPPWSVDEARGLLHRPRRCRPRPQITAASLSDSHVSFAMLLGSLSCLLRQLVVSANETAPFSFIWMDTFGTTVKERVR
jgi:hypothetical protein